MLVAEGYHLAARLVTNAAEKMEKTLRNSGFGAILAENTGSLLAHKPARIFSITISGA
jgi:hypothetical protein